MGQGGYVDADLHRTTQGSAHCAPIAAAADSCSSSTDKPIDERSELWKAHRQLNEASFRQPSGSLFRVEVTELANSQAS